MKIKVSNQHYKELQEERAAIIEYDAGETRAVAVAQAMLFMTYDFERDSTLDS